VLTKTGRAGYYVQQRRCGVVATGCASILGTISINSADHRYLYILNSTIVPVPFMETQRLLELQFHIPNKIPPINCSTTHQHFRNNSSSDQLNLCSSLILFSDLLPLTSLTRFRSTVMAFEGKACIRSISSSLNASFDAEISVVS
jgi:hypothetical protein